MVLNTIILNIAKLIGNGHKKGSDYWLWRLDLLQAEIKGKFKIEFELLHWRRTKFEFYTSRLGMGYKNIKFYKKQIHEMINWA
jgi:arginine decarboxylase